MTSAPQSVDAPMQGAGKAPASPAPSMRRRVALRPAPGARLGAQRARVVAQAPARGRERGGRALQALLRLLRGLDEEQVARLRLRERLEQLPRLLRPARRRSGQPSGEKKGKGSAGQRSLGHTLPRRGCRTHSTAGHAHRAPLACAAVDAGQRRRERCEQPDKSAHAVGSLGAAAAPGSTWRPAAPADPAAAGARAAAGPAPRARRAAPPPPTWPQPPRAPLPARGRPRREWPPAHGAPLRWPGSRCLLRAKQAASRLCRLPAAADRPAPSMHQLLHWLLHMLTSACCCCGRLLVSPLWCAAMKCVISTHTYGTSQYE